ncbi:DoxX family protein [Niastella sp. OAS944]|jgi:putative oxidoreductase|uniref:DoxX family protein n=1 Tax=Niastella sp. OAS944 TaxID=2664089 RepID=UPI00346CBC5E|nr:putative oxidoreductase [Chitinophagaceae bacterium OAS944]
MKRLLSTACSETSFNIAVLVIRVTFGLLLLVNHGIDKLKHFAEQQNSFPDPFHMGHMPSLMLALFAEVFCAVFIILGLFTRIMAIPVVITFAVIVFMVNKGYSKEAEKGILFLAGFFSILLMGPGKYSIDGAMGK